MKKFITLLFLLIATLACTPTLEPEIIKPEPGNKQGNEQPSTPTVVHVQSISLNYTSLGMTVGGEALLEATIAPSDATEKALEWESSDAEVASVSPSGSVTAVAEGSCTITVSCDGKKATCAVIVAARVIPIESVSLDRTSADILVGETFLLTASVLPEDATDKTIVWTSTNSDVASVENGLVTAISEGEATITASAGEFTASCTVKVSVPFSYGGMCLESVSGGYISLANPNGLTIDYALENTGWKTSNELIIRIQVKAGERVWFRGNNECYVTGDSEKGFSVTTFRCYNGDFYLYGNLMSLIYGDEYESHTAVTGKYAFFKLFFQNENIVNHPDYDIELPATDLSPSCYRNMFYGCSKLSRAPKLPARKLEEDCYSAMFCECSSLKAAAEMSATELAPWCCTWMYEKTGIEVAPELPATSLARGCYQFMFMECPDLTNGPSVLPATELAQDCYTGMFQRCKKLTVAPKLPATSLATTCYSHMFNGCESLTKAPELPATTMAYACYSRMFGNSGLETAPSLPATNLAVMCYQYMFENCTKLRRAPDLEASVLWLWCYEKMFNGCTNLNYIKMTATKCMRDTWDGEAEFELTDKYIASYCTNWVSGVAGSGTFVKHPDAAWALTGTSGIPEGWTTE